MAYENYVKMKLASIANLLSSSDLTKEQRAKLTEFHRKASQARNLKVPTQESYVRNLQVLGAYLNRKGIKSYEAAKKKDLEAFLDWRANHMIVYNHKTGQTSEIDATISSSVMTWSKAAIKAFYRWLETGIASKKKLKEKYPEKVDWIEVGVSKNKRILDSDLLTDAEFKQLLAACDNARDRAFFHMLFEGGFRKGELLSVKLKDIKNEEDGVQIIIRESKTTPRTVPLFDSVPDLKGLLNVHPTGDDLESYLFLGCNKKPLRDDVIYETLQYLRRKAGIKKKLWLHLFRHGAATRDKRSGMPDELMVLKFGWSENSRVMRKYKHLSVNDLTNFELKRRGERLAQVDEHERRVCSRCGERSPWTASFCVKCGAVISVEGMKTLATQKQKEMVPEAMQEFVKNLLLQELARAKA